MSIYLIFHGKRPFAWRPWHNWIVRFTLKQKVGIRCGWLWWSLEVAQYDRNHHLKSVATSILYRDTFGELPTQTPIAAVP